ncbi:MAG: choice-of-anchor D domain-containing protein [Bacteroidota bacterium]|nr:choice-of-anchor D domain-containing protein [Chlorobiota bacterium]MDW8271723.1 choice-of-anchor D domain-containing protein [Bacteroidota bacterium]
MSRSASLLSVLLIAAVGLVAQHPRTPLLEEFTSSTCPPCATVKPYIEQYAKQEPDAVIVTYHMDWPRQGDPYNVHNPADNAARRNYYNVGGIPDAYMNGSKFYPGSVAAIRQAAQQVRNRPTPLAMTIQEDRTKNPIEVTVTVKNDGSAPISDATLHVMVLNYYADLTTQLQGQSQHVYTTFEFALLRSLPNGNGTALTLAPNEQKSFTFTYSRGTGAVWVPNNQYVIAFVQLNTTKEVLQASSTLNNYLNRAEISSTLPRFGIAQRSATTSHPITVSNPTQRPLTVALRLNTSSSLVPTGWNISVTPQSLTLQPGEEKTATVQFTTSGNGGFGLAAVEASPQGDGINQPTTYYCGYLNSGTKYAVVYGYMGAGINPFAQAIMSGAKYASETALLPPAAAVELDLPCEAIVVPVDYNGRGAFQIPELISKITQWVQEQKRLFLYGQIEAYLAFNSSNANPTTRSFFTNTLGIRGVQTFTVTVNGQPTPYPYYHVNLSTGAVQTFTVQGKNGDPISDGVSLTLNTSSQYYNPFTDVLQLTTNSPAVPIFTYDNNSQYIGGIRLETNGTRIVFTTFGLEAIALANARNQLAQKIMDWLTAAVAPKPKLELAQTTGENVIEFGEVAVGSRKAHTFKIRNTGQADLVVSEIAMDANDVREYGDVFVITSGGNAPITIAPGGEHAVTIEFRPKKVETIQAAVFHIRSNGGDVDLTVFGDGVQGASVEPTEVSSDGLSLALAPNPVSTDATIRATVNTATAADLRLLDSRGAVVQLATGITGERIVQVDATALSSGVYRVLLCSGSECVSVPLIVVR